GDGIADLGVVDRQNFCGWGEVPSTHQRALDQTVLYASIAFVEPVTQLPLEFGVSLLQCQALPVRHAGPFAHEFDHGQFDQGTYGSARSLRVVAPHVETPPVLADTAREIQALASSSNDHFVGRVQTGNDRAGAEI